MGEGGGSPSPNWSKEVTLRISQEAERIRRSPPPWFARFDGLENEHHPSIFRRRHHQRMTAAAVDVVTAAATPSLPQLLPGPGPSNTAASPPPQLQSMAAAGGGCDIVVAAIGPYHHHLSSPLITHAKKCGIVMFLADQFELDAADFLAWALKNEAQARGCYERGSFAMGPEDLAMVLLLDGCLLLFAVFLLSKSVREDHKTYRREFIYLSADISLHMKQTRLDLLMLDNQIPFFVLEELHRRLKNTLFRNINHSIQQLALSCFDDIHPTRCRASFTRAHFPPKVHHLLHLFHFSRVPTGKKHAVNFSSILPSDVEPHLPCVTELKDSLTRVNKTHTAAAPLDISFQTKMLGTCAVMGMPALCIHNYSDRLFRSLIAFEQNHLRCGLGVTAYSLRMAWLLRSEADVKVLRKRGILMHTQKTDKDIVDFFRGLKDEYGDTCLPPDLLDFCRAVAEHHQSRVAAALKGVGRQCFPRKTVTFFVILGAIISIAILVNTIHTMYRYYHPVRPV